MRQLFFLTCALVVWMASASAQPGPGPPAEPGLVSVEEAETLVYVLPVSHELRRQGRDVAWQIEGNSEAKQDDFFTFWVLDAKRNPYGSSTIGYFSVNKHTGDIWNLMPEPRLVTSPELAGVQRIIRESLGIGQDTIRKWGGLRPPS